mgnify:CR=1 FL=1
MLRSMFSAISGLRGNQIYMDVIGNNIANINTTAFKSARASFSTTLAQTVRPASAPQLDRGGINPVQVGLGTTLASIDTIFIQGDLKSTSRLTDMAIEGEGFFILSDGQRQVYTRDGAFDIGLDGSLLSPATGFKVQGWMVDPVTGTLDTTSGLAPLTIPINQQSPAQATTATSFTGNLDSRVAVGATVTTNMEVYDSLGGTHVITVTFTKAGANSWDWAISENDTSIDGLAGSGTITFDTSGQVTAGGTGAITIDYSAASGLADGAVDIDFTSIGQVAQNSEVTLSARDGATAGDFVTFTVDKTGLLTAVYSNGVNELIGQIALARFANPGGLLQAGNNHYEMSPNSGVPVISTPGNNGLGSVNSGFLEAAHVDLAQQFTDMIIASRGFQANSRVVTTADEMLQELVNLKR